MNYIPKTDWKTDDEVDHDHLNTLEKALADAVTGASTATAAKKTADTATQGVADLRDTKADKTDVDAKADRKYVDDAVGKTLKIGTTATTAMAGNTPIPAATPAGTRKQLDAGTDNTVRAFSAKDIADYVKAQIAALAQPKV